MDEEIYNLIKKTLTGPTSGSTARMCAEKLTPVIKEVIDRRRISDNDLNDEERKNEGVEEEGVEE